MGEQTAISWTDHTFNPWWGCARVSPGCQHCYAEAFAKRTGHDVWGKGGERRFFGEKHWREPEKWNRQAEAEGRRHRVFCASMADVFEDRDDLREPRAWLWRLIEGTPWLDWQLLTKRPENVVEMVPARWLAAPPPNWWQGITTESQPLADQRIPKLLAIPAKVRFLSCEPLIGKVDLDYYLGPSHWASMTGRYDRAPLDWVIAGGESGPGHRPMNPEWARSLRDQCRLYGVPFFFKQWGGRTPKAGGDELDGRVWAEFPHSEAQ